MPLDFFNYQAMEQVTYYPGGVTADAVVVTAVVVRSTSKILQDNLVKPVDIYLPRGSESGKIAIVDVGTDEVLVKVEPYKGEVRCRVVRLLNSDANLWTVRAME